MCQKISRTDLVTGISSLIDTPKLYDSQGRYRGKLSSNPFDPDSVSNPFGRYGNPFSPDSINNPFGAGNPFSPERRMKPGVAHRGPYQTWSG